jgi:hypothetical protein
MVNNDIDVTLLSLDLKRISLVLASLPRSPLMRVITVLVLGPPQGPGASSTPGAPPCVPPGGVGRPLLVLGRSAPPRVGVYLELVLFTSVMGGTSLDGPLLQRVLMACSLALDAIT